MRTFTTTARFVIEQCYKCHIPFGITDDFYYRKQDDGTTFYCPNGHGQIFGTSNIQKLEKELNREREKLKREQIEREHAQGLFEAERNSHRSTRGHITRIKNRVSAGVCPCCNRSFQNLKRHMQGQHPKFTGKEKSYAQSAEKER